MASSARGFTLPELATCVAVLAIGLALGVPAFTSLRDGAAALGTLHGLTASLAAARLAAVSRRRPVSVCPSADGRRCRTDLVWDDGWIVFADPDRLGQPANADAVLQHALPAAGIAVRSTAGRHRVRFQASGMAGGNNLTLRVCRRRGATAVASIIVNGAGRARTQRTPEGTACAYTP